MRKKYFSGEKLFFTSYFTKCSNLLGQIMTPRSGNSHIEYCSMLRIVSFVIHFKASISLDVFISFLSQIMVIFDVKKENFPNFQKCSVSTFSPYFRPNYLRKIYGDPLFSFWISIALATSNKSHMGTNRKNTFRLGATVLKEISSLILK